MYLAGAASPFIYLLLPIQACGQDHTRLSCPVHTGEHLRMLVFVSELVSSIFLSWCTEIVNEDLLSSFTKLRSPASMSSFLDFHGSIVLFVTMTQWFSSRSRYMWADQYKEVKCNAIGCGPIHNVRTNRQLLYIFVHMCKMKRGNLKCKNETFTRLIL